MNDPIVAVVPVENISVEEGFNPRTTFDPDELAGLAESLTATEGVVQSLAVQAVKGEPGKYTLVAGERRLRGLREAGIEKVPVLVLQSKKALLAALAENEQRVDLNPIERANGIKALMELHGLSTHKEVVKKLGKKGKKGKGAAYVGDHLRLLKLPEAVQAYFAAGTVPIAAERNLRAVAEVSPALAECACRLVKEEVIEAGVLTKNIGHALMAVADSDLPGKPPMIDARHGDGLSAIVTDPDTYADLAERYQQAVGEEQGADPFIRFGGDEVDAARAAGCLIEASVMEWERQVTVAYITDAALAADLATRVIERRERELAEAVEDAPASSATPVPDDSPTGKEAAKQAARAERVKARKKAERLHDDNTAIGRALISRRGAKNRKENKLAWARAVAAVMLADHPDLAAAGIGLAFENLQEVERRAVKSTGEEVKKVTYAGAPAADTYLADSIFVRATTADQVYELLGEALVALHAVDAEAVPQSRRPHCWMRGAERVQKILADQIKAVRPRRRAAKRS